MIAGAPQCHSHLRNLERGHRPGQQQHHHHTGRRRAVRAARASSSSGAQAALPLPEPLVWAAAVVRVALRRAQDAALDAAADVSVRLAEAPQQMQDFRAEVQAVAERELRGGASRQALLLSAPPSGSGSSGSGGAVRVGSEGGSGGEPLDLNTVVDELRADIAASRALLQQIRMSQQAGGGSGVAGR